MVEKSSWDAYWGEERNFEHWQRPDQSVVDFIKACDKNEQMQVLDLGCGLGRHAIAFAEKGFDVMALDGSEQALKELENTVKKLKLNIKTVEGNYLEPIFPQNTFDIILSYNVIYHGYREDFQRAIDLCENYLKPGGVMFFTCPTREDGKYGSGKGLAPHTYESMNSVHPGDIHYFTDENDIKQLVKGLEVVSLTRDEHYWDHDGEKQFSSYWKVIVTKPTGKDKKPNER